MARQRKPFDAVQFTRESAERIAGVVRAAETAAPSGSPLTFARQVPHGNLPSVKVISFTGVWAKSQVRMFVKGNTPTTSMYGVYNYFAQVGTANTAVSTMAAIARVPNYSTNIHWVLIAAECNT